MSTNNSQPAAKKTGLKRGPKLPKEKIGAKLMAEVFIEEYIKTRNPSKAAIAAGFSAATARSKGCQLVKQHHDAIQARRAELIEELKADTYSVLREVQRVSFADLRQLFDENGNLLSPSEWPDEVAGAVAGIDVEEKLSEGVLVSIVKKVKLWNKNEAIEKLMKHLGLYEKDNRQKADAITDLMK